MLPSSQRDGPASSGAGAERARNGHSEPYSIPYIGIGVAVVAAVGGTVAVLASSSGKKKKAAPGASPAD